MSQVVGLLFDEFTRRRIKAARAMAGLTQEGLGEKLGRSRGTISRIERGAEIKNDPAPWQREAFLRAVAEATGQAFEFFSRPPDAAAPAAAGLNVQGPPGSQPSGEDLDEPETPREGVG